MLATISKLLGIDKLLTTVIAVAVVIGAIWGVYELVKAQGAQEVRDAIERENNAAISKGHSAARSFDECLDAGGVWNFSTSRCSSAEISPRQ